MMSPVQVTDGGILIEKTRTDTGQILTFDFRNVQ